MSRRRQDVLNDTSGLRCFGTLPDSPCANFDGSAGEVANKLHIKVSTSDNKLSELTHFQAAVTGVSDLGQCASCADLLLFRPLFLIRGHRGQTFFKGNRERDEGIASVVLINPFLDLWEPNERRGLDGHVMINTKRRTICSFSVRSPSR